MAFGQSGARGWAFGSSVVTDDGEAPQQRALLHCRDKGRNCRVVLDGVRGCVALAVGIDDNAFAAETRTTRIEAARAALNACLRHGKGDCEIKKTFCEP